MLPTALRARLRSARTSLGGRLTGFDAHNPIITIHCVITPCTGISGMFACPHILSSFIYLSVVCGDLQASSELLFSWEKESALSEPENVGGAALLNAASV